MGISKYNNEGYYDPTTYEALTNVIRAGKAVEKADFKPLVYICSPYSGDVEENLNMARTFCRFAVDMNVIPIAPHLLFPQFMSDKTERKQVMFMNYVLLGKCDELWVFGSTISNGMAYEIEIASKRKQKIRRFTEECEEA